MADNLASDFRSSSDGKGMMPEKLAISSSSLSGDDTFGSVIDSFKL